MTALSPRDGYRLWAATYAEETAISFLDEELARALSPSPTGRRLLDAGCGTGRRMRAANASLAIGIDASPEMLDAGEASAMAAADLCALPFVAGSFDLIWCRLVLGHLRTLQEAYDELARVCVTGGALFVSDFHADAALAGHTRSFRDSGGTVHQIEHHIYSSSDHVDSAARSGFALKGSRDGAVGPSIEHFYARAGRRDVYARDLGLPLVAAFSFRRKAD